MILVRIFFFKNSLPFWIINMLSYYLENFYFVVCCLKIMFCTFHYFDCNITIISKVFAEPNS